MELSRVFRLPFSTRAGILCAVLCFESTFTYLHENKYVQWLCRQVQCTATRKAAIFGPFREIWNSGHSFASRLIPCWHPKTTESTLKYQVLYQSTDNAYCCVTNKKAAEVCYTADVLICLPLSRSGHGRQCEYVVKVSSVRTRTAASIK